MKREKNAKGPWGLLSMLVLAVALGGLVVALSPDPAVARCKGEGNPYWWSVGWGKETVQSNGTCDGLGDYYGKVTDGKEDKNCVDLYHRDDEGDIWIFEIRSCVVGDWKDFHYDYVDENAQFRLCKNNSGVCSDPPTWNWGF